MNVWLSVSGEIGRNKFDKVRRGDPPTSWADHPGHYSFRDLRYESQVRHRPIVFQLRGVEERLLQQWCDNSKALRNRQLTTKQWCIAHYGQIRPQNIDGLLQNWRRHLVQGTRLRWGKPLAITIRVIRRTSSAKKFRHPVKDASAGTDSSGLAFPQCLLESYQLSVPKFSESAQLII